MDRRLITPLLALCSSNMHSQPESRIYYSLGMIYFIIQQFYLTVSSFVLCRDLLSFKWPKGLGLVSVPVALLLIFVQKYSKVTMHFDSFIFNSGSGEGEGDGSLRIQFSLWEIMVVFSIYCGSQKSHKQVFSELAVARQ